MSIPAKIFKCSACDFTASSSVMWGRFEYDSDGNRISLNRTPGWCHDCESIRAIEEIPSIDEIHKLKDKSIELQTKLESEKRSLFLKQGWFLRLINNQPALPEEMRELEYQHDAYINDANSYESVANILTSRTSPPRCLMCGSTHVNKLPPIPDVSYGEFKPIQFKHPGCSGGLFASESGTRLNVKLKRYVYDTEGLLLFEDYAPRRQIDLRKINAKGERRETVIILSLSLLVLVAIVLALWGIGWLAYAAYNAIFG